MTNDSCCDKVQATFSSKNSLKFVLNFNWRCYTMKKKLTPKIISAIKNQPGILLNMMKHPLPTTKVTTTQQ